METGCVNAPLHYIHIVIVFMGLTLILQFYFLFELLTYLVSVSDSIDEYRVPVTRHFYHIFQYSSIRVTEPSILVFI